MPGKLTEKLIHLFFHQWYRDFKAFFERNGKAFWEEMIETQEVLITLAKIASFQKVSSDEKDAIIDQFKDLGKMGLAFSIFIVPGGFILLTLLARFLPWDLLPSKFQNKIKTEVKVGDDFFSQSEMEKIKIVEKELKIKVEHKKVYWLIDDFEKAMTKIKGDKFAKSLMEHYLDPNHHLLLPLTKHLKLSPSKWKKAIKDIDPVKYDKITKELSSGLFKVNLEKKVKSVFNDFEKLIKYPIPAEVILLFSFSLFEKEIIFDHSVSAIYFGLDNLLMKVAEPEKKLTLDVSLTLGRLLRHSFKINDYYFQSTPHDIYDKLPYRERFFNEGLSLLFTEEIISVKEWELFSMDKKEFHLQMKWDKEDILRIKGKSTDDQMEFLDRYISLLTARKMIKKFSYNELLFMSSEFYFNRVDEF